MRRKNVWMGYALVAVVLGSSSFGCGRAIAEGLSTGLSGAITGLISAVGTVITDMTVTALGG